MPSCPNCGKYVKQEESTCPHCGFKADFVQVGKDQAEQREKLLAKKASEGAVLTEEEKRKQEETALKRAGMSKGQMELEGLPKSGWNWWAFLFGSLWYFYKGMFGKGFVLFAVGCVGIVAYGIPTVIAWIYAGMKGNEDYYIHRKKTIRELEA